MGVKKYLKKRFKLSHEDLLLTSLELKEEFGKNATIDPDRLPDSIILIHLGKLNILFEAIDILIDNIDDANFKK